ncbi:MAG: hypothetical protein U0W40_18885 [Acidimicrobiia bacterium]
MKRSVGQPWPRTLPPAGSIARPLAVAGLVFVSMLTVLVLGAAVLAFWAEIGGPGGLVQWLIMAGAVIVSTCSVVAVVVVAGGLFLAFVRALSPHRHWKTGPT